jgi:hypothetical protein
MDSPALPWPGSYFPSGQRVTTKRFTMNYLLMIPTAGVMVLVASAGAARPTQTSPPASQLHAISPAPATRAQVPSMPQQKVTHATQVQPQAGQPNASCGSLTAPNTPGNAAGAPGSAFNPDGKAGTVYAGEQPQNSRNPVSVSQYDAACLHQK